jgi:hypothetical protein
MKLTLERKWLTPNSTIGVLDINDEFQCFTLEDVMREPGVKVPGATCIPEGTYPVILSWSPKKARIMPRLIYVPNFTGILIHSGNDKDDTEGCILVGRKHQVDRITESVLAFNDLFEKLKFANLTGETISIDVHLDPSVKFVP